MTDTTDTTTTQPPGRHVQASVHFVVDADVTDWEIELILAAMFAQVDGEAVAGYDDSGNENVVPVRENTVRYAIGSGR